MFSLKGRPSWLWRVSVGGPRNMKGWERMTQTTELPVVEFWRTVSFVRRLLSPCSKYSWTMCSSTPSLRKNSVYCSFTCLQTLWRNLLLSTSLLLKTRCWLRNNKPSLSQIFVNCNSLVNATINVCCMKLFQSISMRFVQACPQKTIEI